MSNYYSSHPRLYVAVDCIIFGFDNEDLKILLIKRNFEPCKGEWSLMGGFPKEKETLDEAAVRILKDLTGLDNIYMEQLYTYGELDRDPGERVISVAYSSIIKTDKYLESKNDGYDARWFSVIKIPDVIFDHKRMIEKAIRRLRRRAASEPIGFELLPEKFTIPQLRKLYEAIYQEKLDKRNFSKKIFSMNVMEKLDTKDKSSSKKGAFLYRFDIQKYNSFINSGELFKI